MAQAIISPPPMSPGSSAMPNPARLETGIDTRISSVVATPAKIRTAGWNQAVSPRMISSTPMISEPAPAVVDMAMVTPPNDRCA